MKKSIKILALTLAVITALSAFSLSFAADKTEVKKIVLSDYSYTVYYNEPTVYKPSLSASSSVPYKPSPVYVKLYLKSAGEWKEFGNTTLIKEGTYRWEIQVRIDGDNAKKYKFASNPSVYVDSKKWSAGTPTNASAYSTILIYSPEFKITKSDVRPSKTKIKSVAITVPTINEGDKIPTSYNNITLSAVGCKWSTASALRVYCPEIQGGALSAGTTVKKGKTYYIYLYIEPKDNYEFSTDTVAKINGSKVASQYVSLSKNSKGTTELLVKYAFTAGSNMTDNNSNSNTGSKKSLWTVIKNIFASAFNFLKALFKFFK